MPAGLVVARLYGDESVAHELTHLTAARSRNSFPTLFTVPQRRRPAQRGPGESAPLVTRARAIASRARPKNILQNGLLGDFARLSTYTAPIREEKSYENLWRGVPQPF